MKNFMKPLLAVVCITALVFFNGCSTEPVAQDNLLQSQISSDAHANNRTYSTSLKGSNEVPAVETKATGHATVKVSKDGESIDFKITVGNIENVTQAHLHMAPSGSNGGVVAFLYGFFPDASGRVNGILAEGTLTASDLRGPLAGQSLQSLIDAIDSGMIYVNVHTVQVPSGELRGQL